MAITELAPTRSGWVDLRLVWRDLLSGRERVTHSFFTPTECGLALARQTEPEASKVPQLSHRRRLVLESVLRGVAQSTVALDLDLAPSTIAIEARAGLRYLGVESKPPRAHPLLMLAAAAAADSCKLGVRVVEHATEDFGSRLLVIPRPDLCLHALPQAQRATVGLLVEGCSHAEMASHRGTSQRTIANQVAASFRALGCSGRCELVHRLFVLSGWLPERSKAARPSTQVNSLSPRHKIDTFGRVHLLTGEVGWSSNQL